MSDCRSMLARQERWLSDAANADERRDVQAHHAECPHCRAYVQQVAALEASLEVPAPPSRSTLLSRWARRTTSLRRGEKLALGAIAAAGVVALPQLPLGSAGSGWELAVGTTWNLGLLLALARLSRRRATDSMLTETAAAPE